MDGLAELRRFGAVSYALRKVVASMGEIFPADQRVQACITKLILLMLRALAVTANLVKMFTISSWSISLQVFLDSYIALFQVTKNSLSLSFTSVN